MLVQDIRSLDASNYYNKVNEFVIQILESGFCQCASMTIYYHVWAYRTNVVPLSNGVSTHELYLCKAIYWTNHGDCEGS